MFFVGMSLAISRSYQPFRGIKAGPQGRSLFYLMQIKTRRPCQSYFHSSMNNNYKHRNDIGLVSKAFGVIKLAGNRQANLIPLWVIRSSCFHTSVPTKEQMAAPPTGASWRVDSA